MYLTPEYPYELSDETVPEPVDSLNDVNHGPPDDPPVMSHPRPHVALPLFGSSVICPAQYVRSLPWYLPAAG